MIGRNIARKVIRNLTHPIGLGWSLGTAPDGGPGPVAIITPDSQILPTLYTAGNGYFPTSPTQNGYTGITTYEGYEGHCVFFDGWQSVSNPYIVDWEWDFGAGTETDELGRNFKGVNAAHCFEKAGTYTVTHTVTDWIGRTSTATVTVIIHAAGTGNTSMNVGTANAPGGTYALTTYYVDAVAGNDANDGKSEATAWQTLGKVMSAVYRNNATPISSWPIKPGDKILFKAGQTFEFSTVFAGGVYFPKGIYFGKYGTGAKPVWQWVTPAGCAPWAPNTPYTAGQYFIAPSSAGYACRKVTANYTSGATYGVTETNSNNDSITLIGSGFSVGFVGFFDIEINFWDPVNQSGVYMLAWLVNSARNVALVRSKIRNPVNCTIQTGDNDGVPYSVETYGVFAISTEFNQYEVSTWSIVLGFFGTFIGMAILNCTMDKGGNHLNYLTGVKHTAICDNVLARPAFGRTALRICGHGSPENGAHYNYVARNKFLGWIDDQSVDIFGGARGGGAHNGDGDEYNYTLCTFSPNGATNMFTEDNIFEGNVLTNYEVGLQLTNCKNLKVRNNLFVTPDTVNARDIHIAGANNGLQMRPINNLQIVNNTFSHVGANPSGATKPNIFFGDSTTTGGASTGGLHTNVEIRNNLSVSRAGYGTAFIEYQNAAQIAVTTEDNNLLDSPGAYWAIVEGASIDFNTFKTLYSKDMASLKTTAGVVTPSPGVSHTPGYPNSLASNLAEATAYRAAFQLSTSSVAVNAGTTAANVWKDNLGVQRPVGAGIDIGAFEYPTIIDAAVLGILLEGSTGYLLLESGSILMDESNMAETTSMMPSAAALTGTEIIPIVQGGATYYVTMNALKTFIEAP